MNYRHIYHAGNFADVIKHACLVMLVEFLQKKPKGFCYLDSHAGAGLYNLNTKEALKTHEFKNGVCKLLTQTEFPVEIARYVNIVKICMENNLYPGSPYLVKNMLRPNDKIIVNELHPEDYQSLRINLKMKQMNSQTAIHQRDAYEFIPAMLPPTPRRGFVLIDPPYENTDEIGLVVTALKKALIRWPQGIYCIWQPIKDNYYQQLHHEIKKVLRNFPQDESAKNIFAEFYLHDIRTNILGLSGCSMIIINPPWMFAQSLEKLLKYFVGIFAGDKGSYRIEG